MDVSRVVMNKGTLSHIAKKITGLLILCSLFLHCLWRIGVFTYFYANQAYIAEELCINRDRPEMECQGSCYLDEMMSLSDTEQHSHPGHHIQWQEIHLYLPFGCPELPLSSDFSLQDNKWRLTSQLSTYTFYRNSVFQPPRV